jgi:acyl dehydratase
MPMTGIHDMELQSGLYFEDYIVGEVRQLGSVSLSESEMIEFARKYDPQEFHVNPKKAAAGPFGGLIASGWHTGSIVMRQFAEHYLDNASSLGSPGLDELRWLAPVRPGDVLSVRASVTGARRSNSKPDRGVVHTHIEIFNQDQVLVMMMKAVNVVACRGVD